MPRESRLIEPAGARSWRTSAYDVALVPPGSAPPRRICAEGRRAVRRAAAQSTSRPLRHAAAPAAPEGGGMSVQKSRVLEALKMIEPINAQSIAESRQAPLSPCPQRGHAGGFQLPDHEELQQLLHIAADLALRLESALRASLSSAERLPEQPVAAALNRHRSFLKSLVAALTDPDADACEPATPSAAAHRLSETPE